MIKPPAKDKPMEQTHANAPPLKTNNLATDGNQLPIFDADLSYSSISRAALRNLTFWRPQNYFDWRKLRRIGI